MSTLICLTSFLHGPVILPSWIVIGIGPSTFGAWTGNGSFVSIIKGILPFCGILYNNVGVNPAFSSMSSRNVNLLDFFQSNPFPISSNLFRIASKIILKFSLSP